MATIYSPTDQYKVILEVQPSFQDNPDALSKIYVQSPAGMQVPSALHVTERHTVMASAAVQGPSPLA